MKREWYKVVWKKTLIVGSVFSIIAASGCKADGGRHLANAASTSSSVANKTEFKDIEGHWAKSSILNAVQKGYVDGYEDQTFRPDSNVTRAEFLKMTVTALKLQVSAPQTGESWYTPYVNAAVNAGIHHWSDFTTGDWNTPISRMEMARISLRATTKDLQIPGSNMTDNLMVYSAVKKGLIQGLNAGELALNNQTTRAQSVTIIERILTVNNGGTLPVDKYAESSAEIGWHKTNLITMLPRYFSKAKMDFDPSKMIFTADDGNFLDETEKLVVIDTDDPNDPNRNLVPSDLKWRGYGQGNQMFDIPSNSYLILSFNHIKLAKKYGISPAYSFAFTGIDVIQPDNFDYKQAESNPSNLISQMNVYTDSKRGDPAIEVNYPGHEFGDLMEQYYIRGSIIPKGDLSSGHTGTVFVDFFQPIEFGGKIVKVYESDIDPSIHQ